MTTKTKKVKAWCVVDKYGRAWNTKYGAILPSAMTVFPNIEMARYHKSDINKTFLIETFVMPCTISFSLPLKKITKKK